MSRRKLTVDRYKEIERLLAAGRGVREITRALKCSRRLVRQIRDGLHGPPDQPRSTADPPWMAQINWPEIVHDLGLGHPLKFLWDERTAAADRSGQRQRGPVRGFRLRPHRLGMRAEVLGDRRRRDARGSRHRCRALHGRQPLGAGLGGICSLRGRPAVIRTDNGNAFTGKAMLTWAARNGVALRLILHPGVQPTERPQSGYLRAGLPPRRRRDSPSPIPLLWQR